MEPVGLVLIWFMTIFAVNEEVKDLQVQVNDLEAYVEVVEGVAIKTAGAHAAHAARYNYDRELFELALEVLNEDLANHDHPHGHKPDHSHPEKP